MKKTKKYDKKRVVCIGGGTGTFVTLRGLKHYPIDLSAIVTMSDSGGSNKRIRDEFGLLPTSDIRQCFVGLSDDNGGVGLIRKLFMYRFEKGKGIKGMTFGNLFMAALTDILGSQKEAIEQTGKVLKIHGKVIPVSYTDTHLFAEYEDGSVQTEEHFIDEPPHDGRMRINKLWLKPQAKANEEAIEAIYDANLLVLGPGDLYTSLLPNLIIAEIADAVKKTKATVVHVMNLMTKYGQTYQYSASDHMQVLETYIGNAIDIVLLHKGTLPKNALHIYKKCHEERVKDDLQHTSYTVMRKDIASLAIAKKASSDKLVRSLIRHDSAKLAKVLYNLLNT